LTRDDRATHAAVDDLRAAAPQPLRIHRIVGCQTAACIAEASGAELGHLVAIEISSREDGRTGGARGRDFGGASRASCSRRLRSLRAVHRGSNNKNLADLPSSRPPCKIGPRDEKPERVWPETHGLPIEGFPRNAGLAGSLARRFGNTRSRRGRRVTRRAIQFRTPLVVAHRD
jgi:hypothetical protein